MIEKNKVKYRQRQKNTERNIVREINTLRNSDEKDRQCRERQAEKDRQRL